MNEAFLRITIICKEVSQAFGSFWYLGINTDQRDTRKAFWFKSTPHCTPEVTRFPWVMALLSTSNCLLFALAILFCLSLRHYHPQATKKRVLPLPPGPPRKPFFGNLFDIPRDKAWIKFAKWHQQYGRYNRTFSQGQSVWLESSNLQVTLYTLKHWERVYWCWTP